MLCFCVWELGWAKVTWTSGRPPIEHHEEIIVCFVFPFELIILMSYCLFRGDEISFIYLTPLNQNSKSWGNDKDEYQNCIQSPLGGIYVKIRFY